MGVLSTFTSRWYSSHIRWPDWFVAKYRESVHFADDLQGTISSKYGARTYWPGQGFADLCEDVRRAVAWDEMDQPVLLVFLDQHGEVTRATISRDGVLLEVAVDWD